MADKLRITFELELADNPPLYQELSQFPKGARRTSRLRTLAHAGLMAQANPQTPPPPAKALLQAMNCTGPAP
jgi:hypothetical protein